MTVASFIAEAYLAATGKVSTLTSSDGDWTKLLALANRFQHEWATTPGTDWTALYSPAVSCGTVTATDTFNLDSSIYAISSLDGDSIRINHTDGVNFTDYDLISPQRLKHYSTGNYVAQVGATLKFNVAFKTTDPPFGGTITVPAFTVPDDLVNSTDTVAVDDPHWLAVRCAAEYVRTDITRQAQYPNLITLANELMQKMIENNTPQVNEVPLDRVATGRTF